jgi:hypothetical protein
LASHKLGSHRVLAHRRPSYNLVADFRSASG